MTFTTRKAAALAAAAALAMSGATGVANAQSGTLSSDSLGTGSDLGSVEFVPPANATDVGSLDTSGSLIGEPTLGSLAEPASEVLGSVRGVTGSSITNPQPGTGSIDTSGSLKPLNPGSAGEPTTGSLADIYAPLAGSLGIGGGVTTIVEGSLGTGTGSLVPVVLGVGSVAAVGAGIYYAPEIRAAIENAGFELPPLPPLPQFPNLLPPPPAPAPAPAPVECECP